MTSFNRGVAVWATLTIAIVASDRAPSAARTPSAGGSQPSPASAYVGSAACARCHAPIYERWRRTRMANVVRDPKVHPDAILPDLTKPDPLLTFSRDQIAFVYGSKWKQRYFAKVGDDYFPLPAQWDITHRQWRSYNVAMGTDWWTAFYPPENSKRPTGPTCDGCHAVNYNVTSKAVTEWNVGCERCHGPGSEHVARPTRATIVNPSRLDPISAVNVCIQCHSQGRPLVNPVEGRYFDWPVGFRVGLNLKDYWQLEEFKPGETTFTHFADGTAHKNRMQGNDFVQSAMYTHGVTCASCHDVHGTEHNADLIKSSRLVCLTCHGPKSPNGPHAATLEQHTHHAAGSPGGECIACHMPAIEQTIADVMVRSHTFKFITPSMTEALKVPNPCVVCHKDKTNAWATETLRSWPEFSPWRVGQ